jgi:hypothetical protein
MALLQSECAQSERLNSFLASRLDAETRHAFVVHLGVCESCSGMLRDLREDKRLAGIPLTAEERTQIRTIVGQAREDVARRLEDDRRRHEAAAEKERPPTFAPLALTLPPPNAWRVYCLATAAALLLAAAIWWFFWT